MEYMRKLKRLIKLRRYRKTNLRKEEAYEPVQLSRRPQKRKPRRRKSCRRRRRRQRSDAAGERARRRRSSRPGQGGALAQKQTWNSWMSTALLTIIYFVRFILG